MLTAQKIASEYIRYLKEAIDSLSLDCFEDILNAIVRVYENDNSVFVMGNGGSSATASHFACDINKGVSSGLSKRFKVICLNDNIPTLLAYANDASYDDVFVEQLKNFFATGDLVIGISVSGNSNNVIKAVEYANEHEGTSIALTGFDGGQLAKTASISMVVPIYDMQKAEDIHLILSHMIMQSLYNGLTKDYNE